MKRLYCCCSDMELSPLNLLYPCVNIGFCWLLYSETFIVCYVFSFKLWKLARQWWIGGYFLSTYYRYNVCGIDRELLNSISSWFHHIVLCWTSSNNCSQSHLLLACPMLALYHSAWIHTAMYTINVQRIVSCSARCLNRSHKLFQ